MENVPPLKSPGGQQRALSGEFNPSLRPRYVEVPSPAIVGGPSPGLLVEYFQILRRHKGALTLLASFGFFAAILLTLPQTPIYQAHASLEIKSLNDNFLNMRNISPTSGTASEGGAYPPQYDLQTQVSILKSDSVLARVISNLHLEADFPKASASRFPSWRRALGLTELKPESPRQQALRAVRKNLKISTEANTRVVQISYDSKNPDHAAEFVNTLISEFIRENLEARRETTQQTGEWLTQQMESTREKLEKSEDTLQRYAYSSGLLFTSQRVGTQLLEDNVAQEKLRQLQEELSSSHADRVSKQSIYEIVSTAPPDSLPEVLDDKTLAEYHLKITDLRRQIAELSSSLTAENPAVVKVEAQLATLETARDRERANVVRRLQDEYDSANRRETLLAANYASQARLVSDQAADVAHYNILKSDVDTNRQLYDAMLRDVQEAGLTSALQASNIRVIDPAVVPARPYKPSFGLNALLGLLAGGFFGLIFFAMRDGADRSIQAPGDAALSLGIPEFGVIPSRTAERSAFFRHYQTEMKGLEAKDLKRPCQIELVVSEQAPSVVADSFRAAATSLLYAGESGSEPRVIALTSTRPGDGKTTVASNLALALAETGLSVLLVDGDMRRGRLHEIFGVSNDWGLSDLLAGIKPPAEQARTYFETCYPHLYLLPSGRAPASIAGLLHSPRAPEYLNSVRGKFQTIIIDTPPMLQMPDARVLARLTDGVILVLRSAQTTKQEAAAAAQRLAEDGTHVLGTILNDWDPRETSSQDRYGLRFYPCRGCSQN